MLAEKLPPNSEAAKNLQAEIERQVNELVHYWEERRSTTAEDKEGQPVREYARGTAATITIAVAFAAVAPVVAAWLSSVLR